LGPKIPSTAYGGVEILLQVPDFCPMTALPQDLGHYRALIASYGARLVTIDHDCGCDLRHPGGEVIGRELVTQRACRWSAIPGNISANQSNG
jgi:hypothetical protein